MDFKKMNLGAQTAVTTSSPYSETPPKSFASRSVEVKYHQISALQHGNHAGILKQIISQTPAPKGATAFSNIHVVRPCENAETSSTRALARSLREGAVNLNLILSEHTLGADALSEDPMKEYEAIFETASSILNHGADRRSLVIFVGMRDTRTDAFGALIAMLPFRGLQLALISQQQTYPKLKFSTPSDAFSVDSSQPCRMGMFPCGAIFGLLPNQTLRVQVKDWAPVEVDELVEKESDAFRLPFKIGGLSLPMVTHNGRYDEAIDEFRKLLAARYPNGYFPIVSCGESVDSLGYGRDILLGLGQERSLYFTHKSGESFKRYDNYASPDLLEAMVDAKNRGQTTVIIAVGGGVNGNSIGLIAGMTGSDFVEVPTTPMHYNDATTSAKKAFSLVSLDDDVILSKNILGCFYLPQLVYCVNEMFLTITPAAAHATVGESSKTMNMLGIANSKTGARDYHNILGAHEFASDFTKILKEVSGFEKLVSFIKCDEAQRIKRELLRTGAAIKALRDNSIEETVFGFRDRMHVKSTVSLALLKSPTKSRYETLPGSLVELDARRISLLEEYRSLFQDLSAFDRDEIKEFLTVINKEIVQAKAMFLAYSDPFEKYRALLFEYAHTLGHGIEAFANKMYTLARQRGIVIDEDAIRLHGQCVGMAVTWAGQMSADLGVLGGEGLALHQSFVYLFNRHGGFTFKPLRQLAEALDISCDELCEGVLKVVRRDNKRGYCNCSDITKSVDQLVIQRPGRMMRSKDPNAELRYLVEVDESLQLKMLRKAFKGDFDLVADLVDGKLTFEPVDDIDLLQSTSNEVSKYIRARVKNIYQSDAMCVPCGSQ
jgi:3-dehydroquinate synthetase